MLQVPGENISSVKLYNKKINFRYEPTDDARLGIWHNGGNYTVQVTGYGYVYGLASTQTAEIAYSVQKKARELLNKGADVVITGLGTARLESLEDKLKKKTKTI